MREMSAAMARRTALAAQGLASPHSVTEQGASSRAVHAAIDRTKLLQIDSVSVLVRAHYAPIFSRVGKYDRAVLDRAAWTDTARRPRKMVEYWAHEAALIPVEDWPLMRWRTELYEHGRWGGAKSILERNPTLTDDVLDVIADGGPASAGEIERALEVEQPGRKGLWWDRSEVKVVCEQLFAAGVVSVATRVGFVRHYDLTERVIPAEVLAQKVSEPDAVRSLIRRSAVALGIATEPDLRDYYRLSQKQAKRAVAELVEEGALEPVEVRGWGVPAYLHTDARIPRMARGAALLCPFDPMIFFRPRVERIFDFHYRIEIYTPQPKRIHGYYVFPFLLDGELVARVDLKQDRVRSELQVLGAFVEGDRDAAIIAQALSPVLREMADWLELETVVPGERGDLIPALVSMGELF
ncbi:crosslink repair DNA glycosylase YcaQ family protein [Rhodococcus sp. G-MC3]|uniref:winged helix-turn-helix domain-containing protein n=1 Tax=Rhodococcus sp. G-MC3 TaxID=3046209 RepID=UPI0024BB391F|nr:crosslink repair DNA glycosylase YcaQ family protein [Rhodococcus sp. G-MC3]MDJ0391806.1 crosslink repair DNA glycosylase YcaQ family protein [Rhodococcus sp. G-MC3]